MDSQSNTSSYTPDDTGTKPLTTDKMDSAPAFMQWLPVLAAGGYFAWSHFIKKYNIYSSVLVSLLIGMGAAIPLFSWQGGNLPPAAVPDTKSDSGIDGSARKTMIRFMLDMDSDKQEGLLEAKAPVGEDARKAAYNSLSNDELAALYLYYKLMDAGVLVSEAWSDSQFKDAAYENGVVTPSISGISELIRLAMAKVIKATK